MKQPFSEIHVVIIIVGACSQPCPHSAPLRPSFRTADATFAASARPTTIHKHLLESAGVSPVQSIARGILGTTRIAALQQVSKDTIYCWRPRLDDTPSVHAWQRGQFCLRHAKACRGSSVMLCRELAAHQASIGPSKHVHFLETSKTRTRCI